MKAVNQSSVHLFEIKFHPVDKHKFLQIKVDGILANSPLQHMFILEQTSWILTKTNFSIHDLRECLELYDINTDFVKLQIINSKL